MSIADKTAIVTAAFLTLTSLAALIAFASMATAQQPQPLHHVAIPEILPIAVRPLPEQRLTEPVQFFVPKRHADTIYNALLADITAHDGLVIEHSASSHSVQALVPEGTWSASAHCPPRPMAGFTSLTWTGSTTRSRSAPRPRPSTRRARPPN